MSVALVIPVLDEAKALPALVERLAMLDPAPADILMVDGGSGDNSVAIAGAAGWRVMTAERGRARQINAALLADQDLILTMDGFHDEWLQAKFPQLRGRVFRIRHWCEDKTVEDPYKMPRFAFERAYDEILEGVEAWLPKLG